MDQNQRINQIMEALRMKEEDQVVNGITTYKLTFTGEARESLKTELIRLLTVQA